MTSLANVSMVCGDDPSLKNTQTIAAVAAAAARNWSAVEEHFAIALRQAEEFPHRVEIAEIHRFHAMMLIGRRAAGDRNVAIQLLIQALNGYHDIGMPRHVELTRSLALSLHS